MTEAWQEIADELAMTKQGYAPDLNHEQTLALHRLVKWYGPVRASLEVLTAEPVLSHGARDLIARCLKGAP